MLIWPCGMWFAETLCAWAPALRKYEENYKRQAPLPRREAALVLDSPVVLDVTTDVFEDDVVFLVQDARCETANPAAL